MRTLLISIILSYSVVSHSWADSWSDWKHMKNMTLCNIDNIQISHPMVERNRNEERSKYCKNRMYSTIEKELDCVFEASDYSRKKVSEIAENIWYLYTSRIANQVGIKTEMKAPKESFSGNLHIEVRIHTDAQTPEGERIYHATHKVRLEEKATNRYGRKDNMLLESWMAIDRGLGIENADMAAISVISKIVNKMEETFREAREYCNKHNLFQ